MSLSQPLRFLAISGSLRAASSNTTLLRALQTLAPENVQVTLYDGLGDLPHFNPDLDNETVAAPVTDFRQQLKTADAVVICSPEYAHGVPGSLKNALDWIVSSGEWMDKPTALINAAPRSTHAQASLRETLSVMMAKLVPAACIAVSIGSNRVDVAGVVVNAEISAALRGVIEALVVAVES